MIRIERHLQARWRAASITVLLLGLTGCELLVGPSCEGIAYAAVRVAPVDSITEVLPAGPLRIVASTGSLVGDIASYADTVHVEADVGRATGEFELAHGHAGSYRVEVEAEGYRRWVREGVRVRKGECHVRTVELTARLQPLDGSGGF